MTRDERRLALSATRRLLSRDGPLHIKGGHLWIEALPSQEVAKRLGTPVLVYSAARLRDNIGSALEAAGAFPHPVRIHFALKACYLVGVVTLVKEAGLNVEVMSEFEYLLARRIGFTPDQVVVNGPAKRPEFLERAVTDGVSLINVESLPEIDFLDALGPSRRGKAIDVGVRINPLLSRRHRGPFTPPGSKFGFDATDGEATQAVKRIVRSRFLSLRAVHCHSYTRQYTPDAHRAHAVAVVKFVRQIEAKLGIRIPLLDFGGGFGSRYLIEAHDHTLRSFIASMSEPLESLAGKRELIVEPGRYLVNDAAVCLTSILSSKRNSGRRWVLIDAGRNILPSRENAEYLIIPTELRPGRTQHHAGDFLCMPSEHHPLAFISGAVEQGEVLAVFNSGAYTFSMAQNFGELIPNAILVDRAGWTWLHRQRSLEEQFPGLSRKT